MRKKLFYILAPVALFALAGCGAMAHGGNCGCPKFGAVTPDTEQVQASAETQKQAQ